MERDLFLDEQKQTQQSQQQVKTPTENMEKDLFSDTQLPEYSPQQWLGRAASAGMGAAQSFGELGTGALNLMGGLSRLGGIPLGVMSGGGGALNPMYHPDMPEFQAPNIMSKAPSQDIAKVAHFLAPALIPVLGEIPSAGGLIGKTAASMASQIPLGLAYTASNPENLSPEQLGKSAALTAALSGATHGLLRAPSAIYAPIRDATSFVKGIYAKGIEGSEIPTLNRGIHEELKSNYNTVNNNNKALAQDLDKTADYAAYKISSTPKLADFARQELDKIESMGGRAIGVEDKMKNTLQQIIDSSKEPISFSGFRNTISHYGDLAATAGEKGEYNSARIYQGLRNSLKNDVNTDLENTASTSPNVNLQNLWDKYKNFNADYANNVAPYKSNPRIMKAIRSDEPPNNLHKLVTAPENSDVFNHFSPEGKSLVQYQYLKGAGSETPDQGLKISTDKMWKRYSEQIPEDVRQRLFTPEQHQQLQQLGKISTIPLLLQKTPIVGPAITNFSNIVSSSPLLRSILHPKTAGIVANAISNPLIQNFAQTY